MSDSSRRNNLDEEWCPIRVIDTFVRLLTAHDSKSVNQRKRPSPMITLYFDTDKNLTVAVLSDRFESLSVYLQSRVDRRTACRVSPLYYELDGYVRQNLSLISQQIGYSLDSISVAVGALEASDAAHGQQLLMEEDAKRRKFSNVVDESLMETALEIARLHRMNQDLDVLSVVSMMQTSKAFARVATRISTERLRQARIFITPLVDGASLCGYSNFARDDASNLVQVKESGGIVEYQRCSTVELRVDSDNGVFLPLNDAEFSWRCDEIALAHLHRWWGDIVAQDYVGQRLLISWKPEKVDCCDSIDLDIPLGSVRLGNSPSIGQETLSSRGCGVTINVLESKISRQDELSIHYRGCAQIKDARIPFTSLARASARVEIPRIEKEYKKALEKRPILEHEVEYLRRIRRIACM